MSTLKGTGRITVTHFTDPGCPFAYSASPALAVLRWLYGDQLDWRLVTIGLAEDPQRYIDAGYTPTRSTIGQQSYFRRFGMPLLMEPRARVTATSRACRAIVATRLLHPGREDEVLRALQLGWFTTTLLLDQDDRKKFVQYDAQREEVAPGVELHAGNLFRRHVVERADDHALHGMGGDIERPRSAEVHELYEFAGGYHDVFGLDVAVEDAFDGFSVGPPILHRCAHIRAP